MKRWILHWACAGMAYSCVQGGGSGSSVEVASPEALSHPAAAVITADPVGNTVPAPSLVGLAPAPSARIAPVPIPSAEGAVILEPADAHLGELREVTVRFEIAGAQVGAEATVAFVTPKGSVYVMDSATLTGGPSERQRVQFSLPVAGTMIDSARMAGRWTAKLSVGGVGVLDQIVELTP